MPVPTQGPARLHGGLWARAPAPTAGRAMDRLRGRSPIRAPLDALPAVVQTARGSSPPVKRAMHTAAWPPGSPHRPRPRRHRSAGVRRSRPTHRANQGRVVMPGARSRGNRVRSFRNPAMRKPPARLAFDMRCAAPLRVAPLRDPRETASWRKKLGRFSISARFPAPICPAWATACRKSVPSVRSRGGRTRHDPKTGRADSR